MRSSPNLSFCARNGRRVNAPIGGSHASRRVGGSVHRGVPPPPVVAGTFVHPESATCPVAQRGEATRPPPLSALGAPGPAKRGTLPGIESRKTAISPSLGSFHPWDWSYSIRMYKEVFFPPWRQPSWRPRRGGTRLRSLKRSPRRGVCCGGKRASADVTRSERFQELLI